jgi:hypothetical protein
MVIGKLHLIKPITQLLTVSILCTRNMLEDFSNRAIEGDLDTLDQVHANR